MGLRPGRTGVHKERVPACKGQFALCRSFVAHFVDFRPFFDKVKDEVEK
jgi:hypothetical protein